MKFALAFDGRRLESWHLGCVEELMRIGHLAGIVETPSDTGASTDCGSTWLRRRLARRCARSQQVDVSARFAAVSRLVLKDAAAADRLDFVLKLGMGSIPPGAETLARWGLWHFEHESRACELPFFAEVASGECVTIARLLARLPGREQDRILMEGRIATDTRSYAGQRRRIEGLLASWPSHLCRRIAQLGFEACLRDRTPGVEAIAGTGDAAFLMRIAARRLAFAWRRLFRQPQWNIGVLRQSAGDVIRDGGCCEDRIDWMPTDGREGFLADPFGLIRDGTLAILCEYYGYRRGQGWITALEWVDGRFRKRAGRALDSGHHLSYPGLVEHEGVVYCIPESCAAGEIALYRAEAFPDRWQRVRAIVDGFAGVDPTVFRHGDRWWLFSTRRGPEADCTLWVWHARELSGPWEAHALNPVKVDVTGARPGGAVFIHEGTLYRPTQDCSRYYGWRIAIQRVDRLTPTEFAESPACIVEAGRSSPYPLGRHTFTPVGDVVLVDGHREAFVWLAFLRILGIWARDTRLKLAGRR